ncbi:zinc finger protein 141-like isoform X2 [Maniola jurtina]|uniref:zinc finger protein 141-like isoform X2 n=1 Tax=Maniola jurtina TaxID=191418 RepID=UPI001E68E341|nr:zinc finger protein 141-like isoform X2 [Maniola jurtina]
MANSNKLQELVKHIVNGTFEDNICGICLQPLEDLYQYSCTKICTEDSSYCIADVLDQVCNIKMSSTDEYKICATCFIAATQVYKFYLTSRRSQQIIEFYVNQISNQLISTSDLTSDSLCITLPNVSHNAINCDIDINKFPFKRMQKKTNINNFIEKTSNVIKIEPKEINMEFDDLVMILNENGEPKFYKPQENGTLALVDSGNVCIKDYLSQIPDSNVNKTNVLPDSNVNKTKVLLDSKVKFSQLSNSNINKLCVLRDSEVKKKKCRKRNPMEYRQCSQCPVRYRFVRKLKEHMKEAHGIDLFICQVCQALTEDEIEYNNHLQTHSGLHTCSICNMVFKKRETIISHLKWHEELRVLTQSDGAHVCEVCGLLFRDGEDLKEHYEKRHVKRFTCYYCGRMYKGQLSFDLHIKKHEINNDMKQNQTKISKPEPPKKKKRNFTCATCGRDFVDERALLWHERLHTNERPYACDVCGRGFVSLNRRNQHAVCAHTAPARRCPLCPALFHLRSMVNTHIKKVHLKAHKRPNRVSKHLNVFWKTEPVPIQELSVSIQNEILELQAAQTEARQIPTWKSPDIPNVYK